MQFILVGITCFIGRVRGLHKKHRDKQTVKHILTQRTNSLSATLVSENIIVISEHHVVFRTLWCVLHVN